MNLKNVLLESGLEQHEVDIYLTLVALKEATAGELSKKTVVPRTYTYKVLDSLVQKGLVRSQDSPRSIRTFTVTDFQAPKRYLHEKQFSLHRLEQEMSGLESHLETLANPSGSAPVPEELKDERGKKEFWQLLHSTITREIWVINPPLWWIATDDSADAKKWHQYRGKQHVWEKRFLAEVSPEAPFTETKILPSLKESTSSLFFVDQYHIQVAHWNPFRALRIESQEMVSLFKKMLD